MKKYQNILLDLDGTIIDSGEGITKSVQYALAALGIEITDLRTLYPFIGPPLNESFREFMHLNEEQIEQAILKYRERYQTLGIYENKVYVGIRELLSDWRQSGKKVILCTSKPEIFAGKILEYFHLADYFTFIGGATLDGERNSKAEVIHHIFASCSVLDKAETVMIGDRKYDVMGAKQMGVDAIGVLYGYGNATELQQAGADYIVKDVQELRELIEGEK